MFHCHMMSMEVSVRVHKCAGCSEKNLMIMCGMVFSAGWPCATVVSQQPQKPVWMQVQRYPCRMWYGNSHWWTSLRQHGGCLDLLWELLGNGHVDWSFVANRVDIWSWAAQSSTVIDKPINFRSLFKNNLYLSCLVWCVSCVTLLFCYLLTYWIVDVSHTSNVLVAHFPHLCTVLCVWFLMSLHCVVMCMVTAQIVLVVTSCGCHL